MKRLGWMIFGVGMLIALAAAPQGLNQLLNRNGVEGGKAVKTAPRVVEDLRWGRDPDTPGWSITPWNAGLSGDPGWGGLHGPAVWDGFRGGLR